MKRPKPLLLVILDGWGLGRRRIGNAIFAAKTPFYHHLLENYPVARLKASGEEVGLPEGQMGNSEVGHLNIGAGRVVYQELTRISLAVRTGEFCENPVLLAAMAHVKKNRSSLHLLGLVSDGGVHSHISHIFALLELAGKQDIGKVFVHAILDGRDVAPAGAAAYLDALEERMHVLRVGQIATVSGRYYTMDRDRRWERVERAYRAMVYGEGVAAATSLHALEAAYERGETDEFVLPSVVMDNHGFPTAVIHQNDAVIFFNFRPDRARQITRAFTDSEFKGFERGEHAPLPEFACLTQYDEKIKAPVAFPPDHPRQTLGEVLSRHGLRQLRIAETEKYAHVTFFFSGGEEKPFPGEDRLLIPSPKVPTYNLLPQMSAPQVTARVLEEIEKDNYDAIILNYANADMVGHTGIVDAAVKAVEAVDHCLRQIVTAVLRRGGAAIITSDHGNAEQMTTGRTARPFTAHTPNPVPFILACSQNCRLRKSGILADVAPTVLDVLGLDKPPEMTGSSLLQKPAHVKKKARRQNK
ncbi:MAG: 2,3-bisphosphoglycerate-independent phosphoglycerate mutase [Dethiobacter sp.]|jgi:2,3-bisphosphoglycerate-independent phosphoglycerate mutase|nr:2,3-bisphosphoglycerate-independent phosphoglycerate mutase [Dethiobacter sp.]